MRIKRFFIAFVLVLGIAFLVFIRVGGGWSPFDETPITVPIDLSKAGNVVEIKLNVWEELHYRFSLKFSRKDSREDNGVDAKKLDEFLGYSIYDTKTKVETITGTPVPIKVTIYKIDDKNTRSLMLDETYITKGRDSWWDYVARKFGAIDLPRGTYLIRVENLEGFQELADRKVNFTIYRPSMMK
jgi:hypothetical protein